MLWVSETLPVDRTVDQRRRIQGGDRLRGSAAEEALICGSPFAGPGREIRCQDTVQKALEQRGHGPPPGGIDEHQMLGPADQFPRGDEVGFDDVLVRSRGANV